MKNAAVNIWFGIIIGIAFSTVLVSMRNAPLNSEIYERFMLECQEENKWYECHRIWRN